jgi:hypothetical protein
MIQNRLRRRFCRMNVRKAQLRRLLVSRVDWCEMVEAQCANPRQAADSCRSAVQPTMSSAYFLYSPILTMAGFVSIQEDAESGLGAYNDGYPALARWMAQDPDNETLIFRKFDSLSTRNLLYLQAELVEIERRVFDLESQIPESRDVTLMESLRRWETFVEEAARNAAQGSPRPEKELMVLVVSMRKKLKEYRKFIIAPVRLRL